MAILKIKRELKKKIFYFKEGKAIYIKICLVKSGRQGSNLQDLRPKHSVIPNRLLPVYIKDVLEMSILKKKKKGIRFPFFKIN